MVVFTFANNEHIDGYFVASDRDTMDWRKLPHDLGREMEDIKRKGEEVKEVSIGLDGDWFLRTNARQACKTDHERAGVVSNVEQFVQLAQQAGFSFADYAIRFFTFVPDAAGYVAVLHKTDGSLTQCAWQNVPPELDTVLEREGLKGVRHVTVGANGAYVVILNSGAVLWGAGVPERLHQLLEDAGRRRRSVAGVSLSLVQPGRYFVQFADGATDYALPPDWYPSVNHCSARAIQVTRVPKMATSYSHDAPSRSQTYPQYTPQLAQAQFESYSHGDSVPSYGGGLNPGHKFIQSNPHLSSASTGIPQQPVYNVTHIPQQQQQEQQQQVKQHKESTSSMEKYNEVLTPILKSALKGTLRIAGAVLVSELKSDLKRDLNSSNRNNWNSS